MDNYFMVCTLGPTIMKSSHPLIIKAKNGTFQNKIQALFLLVTFYVTLCHK